MRVSFSLARSGCKPWASVICCFLLTVAHLLFSVLKRVLAVTQILVIMYQLRDNTRAVRYMSVASARKHADILLSNKHGTLLLEESSRFRFFFFWEGGDFSWLFESLRIIFSLSFRISMRWVFGWYLYGWVECTGPVFSQPFQCYSCSGCDNPVTDHNKGWPGYNSYTWKGIFWQMSGSPMPWRTLF